MWVGHSKVGYPRYLVNQMPVAQDGDSNAMHEGADPAYLYFRAMKPQIVSFSCYPLG